jgi:UDP-glucose 4-epimerase
VKRNGTAPKRLADRQRKRVVVTGGAGFIGSHLCEALLEQGNHVTVIDNFSTGSMKNISHLEGDPRFAVCEGDVTDEPLVSEIVARADTVYHLAAAVGVRLILADPIESFRTNVLGTESVMRAAGMSGAKVLVASTSEVYGQGVSLPQREDDDVLLGPTSYSRWSYAACKMLDEFIGLAYARRGLRVVCFRLFNTVGPRQTGEYGMVVPRFVEAALAGRALRVHGDGSQSRCFLHVRDAVDAILRLDRADRAIGQVFNVGSSESVTIMELAERVLAATGADVSDSTVSLVPYEQAYSEPGFQDIRARQPDISKIRAATRWRPKLDLDDILRDVIAEYASDQALGAEQLPVAVPALA